MKIRIRYGPGGPVIFWKRMVLALLLIGIIGRWGTTAAEERAPSLSIEEAIRLAVERNERSRIADERVAAAAARVGRARAFFFPDITLSGDYVLNSDGRSRRTAASGGTGGGAVVDGGRAERSVTASMGLTLFNARAFPLYRRAKLERESAALGAKEEKRLLMFETADAFLQTLSLEQVSTAAERRLSFARRTFEDTRTRFEAKLVGLNDLTRAELELATAERELIRTTGEADLARLQLGFLIDANIEGPLAEPSALLRPGEQAEAAGLIEEARRRRLDLAAGEAQTRALEASAEEPLRRIIPSFGLNGRFRTTDDEGLDRERGVWFIGLNLTWLLYDGGERRGDYLERKALARIAGFSLNIFSMIGLLLLMGIVKRNSIILVDYANQLREEGADSLTAMLRAGPTRLRPIFMTSISTLMAALPAALALGPGGEIRAPMAVAVIGGLTLSTVLSLLVVPAFYVIADRIKRKLQAWMPRSGEAVPRETRLAKGRMPD